MDKFEATKYNLSNEITFNNNEHMIDIIINKINDELIEKNRKSSHVAPITKQLKISKEATTPNDIFKMIDELRKQKNLKRLSKAKPEERKQFQQDS